MGLISDKKILLIDKDGIEICRFLESDGLKNVRVSETINGESTLAFSIPKTNEKFQYLFKIDTTLVIDNGKRFTLMKDGAVQSSRNLDGAVYADVNAVETWYLLGNNYVTAENSNKESELVGFSSLLLLSKSNDPLRVNGRVISPSYPVGSAGYALQGILCDSGWSVGTVDDTGKKYDVLTDKKTILENIMEVQRLWGGMIFWDSKNRIVHLRSEARYQPYEQFQIRYGTNLQEITRQQNNAIVTKLYPRGNNNLHIGKVNGGVRFIEDYTYSNVQHVRQVVNVDIYTPDLLLSWGREQLKKLCKPQYQYTVKTLDLSKMLNDKNQDVKLGYMVDVIDIYVVATEGGNERLRVVSYSYDYFHPARCEVGIGDKIGLFVELFRDLTAYSGIVDGTISGDGTIGGDLVNIEDNEEYSGLKKQYLKFEVETDTEFSNAYASIELLSDETQAKITSLTEYTDKKFVETSTSITQLASATEASITSLTNYTNSQITVTTSTLRTEISNAQGAAITQSATYTNQQISGVNSSIASISQTVSGQGSSIYMLSQTTSQQGNRIASIEITTSQNSSAIYLKADRTYVDNLIAQKASINQLNAVTAQIGNLVAKNGTFSGTLSGASGTFSGMLTAGTTIANGLGCSHMACSGSGTFSYLAVGGAPLTRRSATIPPGITLNYWGY